MSPRTVRSIFLVAGALVFVVTTYVLMARSGVFQLDREQLIAKYADSESKFAQIRGIDVHYKDEGTGLPLLLLHGSFGSMRTWDVVVDRLDDDFRLIRIDQPPTALSSEIPASTGDLSLEDFIRLFLDDIGIDRAILVGTSSGGIIAYRFAAKYPDRTIALVIANSPSAVVDNAAIATPRALRAIAFVSAKILNYYPRLYWRLLLQSLYADSSKVSSDVVEQYFNLGRKVRALPISPSMYARVNDNDEIDEILRSVTAPTLLLWGVPDPVLPESTAHQLQAKLSSAETQLVLMEGTGHYPPLESPGLVAEQIKQFLAARPETSQ
jgi:pimeloyl-ACP methyl ester carboxylesterase